MSGRVPPNILLIILDSLRARNCSVYGYHKETTPFLSRFSEDAVLFEQARSPSIHSIASHASIFSGYHTEEHNITEHRSFIEPEATIWHELKQEHGYVTGLFTPNAIVSLTSNLGDVFDTAVGPKRTRLRLFDHALSPLDIEGTISGKTYAKLALTHERPIRSVLNGLFKTMKSRGSHDPNLEHGFVYVDEFLNWADAQTSPWAACLNFMDTHTPYEANPQFNIWGEQSGYTDASGVNQESPKPFTENYWRFLGTFESQYDVTIRQVDKAVEQLITALKNRGILDDTLVVITSDHGEGFGETSELNPAVNLRHHSWGIDEVLTHIPLLVRVPEGRSGGEQVSKAVSLTEFPSVVKAALNAEDPVEAFLPEHEVVSSTYRIKPPGDELDLPPVERQKYFGPWRAVYQSDDGEVLKYANQNGNSITVRIPNAQE